MRAGYIITLLAVMALIAGGLAFGGFAQGQFGQVVQLQGHTITFNGAKRTTDSLDQPVLKANFTVENQGTKDLLVNSIDSFEARLSDGTELNQALCSPGLGGYVVPGHRLRGNICWMSKASSGVTIYYRPGTAESGVVVWELQ